MFKISNYFNGEELKEFCLRHYIRKLSLFGSALRDELTRDSDIDLLVEFDAGHEPGLLELAGIEIELGRKLERRVDVRTPAELSRYFRDDVLARARVEYAA